MDLKRSIGHLYVLYALHVFLYADVLAETKNVN